MMGSMNDKLLSNSDANEYMENRKNVGAGNVYFWWIGASTTI